VPPMFPPHHAHPGLLAAPHIEPIVSGNLPPGFDSSTCRSVYVGNIHLQVTDSLLHEVFQSIGPVEGCKLIRKEKSSFGFVDYYDRRYAALAIVSLNGRQLFGQPIKVNWAYASTQREDTSGVILTSSSGIFALRLRMLLCLLFSRHILPVQMLELCGISRLDDPEGLVSFLLGISRMHKLP
uniref:RRM domain-containing protein n=1 Tax=Aegilops tauschii subsp. strangulata TaxID=200361 RepID=A0A453HXW7_AEGTS